MRLAPAAASAGTPPDSNLLPCCLPLLRCCLALLRSCLPLPPPPPKKTAPVVVADVAWVHLHMVAAADGGELQLQHPAGQLDLPGLALHLELQAGQARQGRGAGQGR